MQTINEPLIGVFDSGVALVTAAVVMLGLSLFTGVEGLLRLALTAGAGLLAGAVAWATARPVLEDDAPGD
mgnify:CR=1 FL=1